MLLAVLIYEQEPVGLIVNPYAFLPKLLLVALLLYVSRLLYFYAYAKIDVALVTVFSSLTPIYTVVAAYVLLGEAPSAMVLAGVMMISGSLYMLFLKPATGPLRFSSTLAPFRLVGRSRPTLYAFLSTVPPALASVLQKELLQSLSPTEFSFYLLLFIGIMGMATNGFYLKTSAFITQLRHIPLHFILVSAAFLPLMHIVFSLALREQATSVSMVLQRFSIPLQMGFAYVFLHEKQEIGKRLTVAGGMLLGLCMIASAP